MAEVAGVILSFIVIIAFFGGLGLLLWTCTDGYDERVRLRRLKNNLALERERSQLALDLKIKEWQATASLEDLTRHRERLRMDLDKMHEPGE